MKNILSTIESRENQTTKNPYNTKNKFLIKFYKDGLIKLNELKKLINGV